jgi:lysylphosphatidylglycerol synthase-like protein
VGSLSGTRPFEVTPVLRRPLRIAIKLWGSSRARLVAKIGLIALAVACTGLAGYRFSSTGWPLHGSPWLILGAGLLFLAAYPVKAWGWRKLFAAGERPKTSALAAAGGAASVTGIALPGRFDDVVRVAVVRRFPNCPAGVRALAFSLFALALIDAVALTPLASTSAALTHSTSIRIALALVAAAGVAAAVLIVVLPRVMNCSRVIRFRLAGWLHARAPSVREAAKATVLVHASWLVRAVGVLLLLGGLGLGLSLPLAMLFLCAGAASAALPVGPAGAATQAGGGAIILVASGVAAKAAIDFALATQALAVMAGAAVVLGTLMWHGSRRLILHPAL